MRDGDRAERASRGQPVTRFVVGLDGSSTAERALVWASRHAARLGAEVVPVMAWQYPLVAMWPDAVGADELTPANLQRANVEAAAAIMHKLADELAGSDIADPIVERGDPGKLVCQVCDKLDADLLVLGSRGLGGFGGLMLGSVSAHCANAAPCPVAVIPDSWDPGAADVDRVVVGVDESKAASDAVAWADAWAPDDAVLHLVHAWQVPITLDRFNNWIDPTVCENAAVELVEGVASEVEHHQVTVEAVRTDARQDLADLAEEADMLVVGARAHRGLGRLLLGSVASSVVHHVTVPTIIVRR